MKFNYAFQKVVDLKTNEKRQAEWMLSAAVGILQNEMSSLEQLLEDKRRLAASMQEEAQKTASCLSLQAMQQYAEHLERCIASKSKDVDHAEQNVEQNKAHLSSRMLDEKVWLKARDKSLQAFRQQMLLREQSELDEMATVRFAMKAR
ncbi:flagellar export protein FliJ [Paenibacillus pinistramenti]|uniref:flagellar export protein FliJ n=1 Tax=Paenibacillus pinistramenti TaxID=1768003 RepID=UPI001109439A|nr:flagellar export protein FliJ [Paenibacillus pinistramenti]